MNGACESTEQGLCGCCAGVNIETPEPIDNRPGLSVVTYRVGRYATFFASLQASLSDSNLPTLALLRTRDSSDFTIALLDAWAITLDILTFYNERIIGESFLRTAVDARSVMDLAKLVGFTPSPGVGASTNLVFTLNSAAGAPDNVLIPAGTRVQSVPQPGQRPQVFETSSDITGVIARNAIPAQISSPWGLAVKATSTWITGTANNINVGDALLLISAPANVPATAGPADFVFITKVQADPVAGNTQITWSNQLDHDYSATGASIYVFRKKAALFGVQAPSPKLFPSLFTGTPPADWPYAHTSGKPVNLDAAYTGLTPAGSSPGSPPQDLEWVVMASGGNIAFFQISAVTESNPNAYTLSSKTTALTLFTGSSLTGQGNNVNTLLTDYVKATRTTTVYLQSDLLTPASLPVTSWTASTAYKPQPGLIVPVCGSSIRLVGGMGIAANQPIGVSGKASRLQVLLGTKALFTPSGASAGLAVTAGQQFMIAAYPPVSDQTINGNLLWSVLTTKNVAGMLSIAGAQVQLAPAGMTDPLTGESAIVSTVEVNGDVVTLALKPALTGIYDATTVTVNANAVAATQGETMHEILGSGDSTNSALPLSLKQSPLTYVASSANMGATSTLQVWVNNLQWHEQDDLLDAGPSDRVFITSRDAKQGVTVEFGDGLEGARPPTGQANIRAVYRKGIGSGGNVMSGQLSQALDRPQGLKGVTNPDAATGGADPDSADDARANAPLEVLTLGRVVSLEDYQNYARAFTGIAKALATWTWTGGTRSIFLTVAGANGSVFQASDNTLVKLKTALWTEGNPYVPITIASYTPVQFEIGANVLVDEVNYDSTQVLGQAWQTLLASFSFAPRAIGAGVAQSQIVAMIQQTPGVLAVELTLFNRKGKAGVATVLRAASPAAGQQGSPAPAELLTLDPACQGNLQVWS